MNKSNIKTYILIGILLLTVVLRVYSLDSRSLWGDEIDSVYKAHDFVSSDYKFERTGLLKTFSHPVVMSFEDGRQMPFYFLLLGFWVNLFGPASFGMRLFSALVGVFSVVIFYFLLNREFDEKTAILSTFLLAISPMHILYSQEIRGYALMLFLGLLSTWFFVNLLQKKNNKLNIVSYFACSLLFAFTHYYAILYLSAQIFIAFSLWLKNNLSKNYLPLLVTQAAVFLIFLLWAISGIIKNLDILLSGGVVLPQASYNFAYRTISVFFAFFFGESIAPWNPILILGAIACLVVLINLIGVVRRGGKNLIVPLILLMFPVLCSMFLKNTIPNYLIFCLPVIIFIGAYSIIQSKSKSIAVSVVLVFALANFISILNYYSLKEMHNSNRIEPWKEISNYVFSSKADSVYVNNAFVVFRELNYYNNILSDKRGSVRFVGSGLSGNRIVFVYSIYDEGEKEELLLKFNNAGYMLKSKKKFVPYGTTLASKLPSKHHKLDQGRAEVYLFEK